MVGPPLSAYFMLESLPAASISPFQANLYLAEDRILAFNILARKDAAWFLDFVPDALAYTDVPLELDALVKQRRRWTNGALFNLIYYLMNIDVRGCS
jgi:chitin synthase